MFKFFKKGQGGKEEIHQIPKQYIPEVYEILDKVSVEKSNRQLRYKLWRKMEKIFPHLDLKDGDWSINLDSILSPVLIRRNE